MIDINLKFIDEAEAKSVLGVFVQDGEWVDASAVHALVIVHPLVLQQPVLGEDGETIVQDAVIAEGFHVNLRLRAYDGYFDAYRVYPSNPRRVWA